MKQGKTYKIAIWGAGGISKEVAFLIEDINAAGENEQFEILGFVEKDSLNKNQMVSGYRILGGYRDIQGIEFDGFAVPIGTPQIKMQIVQQEIEQLGRKPKGFNFVHPTVIGRTNYIHMGQANIVCAGVIMTTDITIGNYNLINLNCTIGHDVVIGDYNVINPGATISGNVKIGNGVLIGTGANVLEKITICDNVIIGAGAVVTRPIQESGTYVGVPARKRVSEKTAV